MEKWFLYLIKCVDGSFYVGYTSDLNRRLEEHNSGRGGRYTKLHKPVEFFYTEEFSDKLAAIKREKQIKGWTRQKKLDLIKYKTQGPG